MGQISLPRLHKLNNGVFLESIYLSKTEMWQAIKLYLFLYNFIAIFHFESILNYKYSWNTLSRTTFRNFNISKKVIYTSRLYSITLSQTFFINPPLILNFYLVYISGSYYALIFLWPSLKIEQDKAVVNRRLKFLPLHTLLYY